VDSEAAIDGSAFADTKCGRDRRPGAVFGVPRLASSACREEALQTLGCAPPAIARLLPLSRGCTTLGGAMSVESSGHIVGPGAAGLFVRLDTVPC